MRKRSLITIALAIALLASGASTASAVTRATAPKLPVLYNLGGAPYAAWNLPQVRPRVFYIFANGSAALVGAPGRPKDKPIRWKSWTQRSAFASGDFTWRNNPSPGPYHFSAVTISLWDVKTRGGARVGVRYYDKMTIAFTHCHCNSHAVLQYYTVGSGRFIAGGWKVISGRLSGGGSATQRGPYVTALATGAVAVSHKTPVAPELVFRNGRYRIVWGVRPAGRFTIFSGPAVYLLGTRWTRWTAATARATGELWGVTHMRIDLGHASIVLSAPKSHNRLVYYSALHIVGGKDVVHYWRWHWTGPEIGWTPVG